MLDKLFKSNDWQWRLCRTIIQGVLSVVIAWIAAGNFDWHYLLVALIPAILSPIMAELGKEPDLTAMTDEEGEPDE